METVYAGISSYEGEKERDSLCGPGRWKIENVVDVAGNDEETRDWCLCDNIKRSI